MSGALPRSNALRRVLAVGMTTLVASACSLVDLGYLGPPGGGGEAGADAIGAGADATADGLLADAASATDASDCPGRAGPPPVRVGDFCIDRTEVTYGQYQEFLAADDLAGLVQPPECAWNDSFLPEAGFVQAPDKPVVQIDWCDAYAYCAWAGKRLCGRVGGGSLPIGSIDNPELDQWFAACSQRGARAFPYGDAFVAERCRDGSGEKSSVAAGSLPTCEGGFPGVFDLSGNAWEWQDVCDGDLCACRGGSWLHTGNAVGCAFAAVNFLPDRRLRQADIGFRCCSP